jgi:flagellar biogenesis protein FliO
VPVPPEPKMSTLEWILVGILGALVVLLLLIGVLALVVRKSGINFFLS